MQHVLQTPDSHFANLPDYPFAPNYVQISQLRMHYVEAGPPDADPVLLLHGEPSWSYLYRHMIPVLTAAGHRVIAPDLIGFGKSDKPMYRATYTYAQHVQWVTQCISALNLKRITLVCQDWGGLIGLRVAGEHQDRFARIVAANTALPLGDGKPNTAFTVWQIFSQLVPVLPISRIIQAGCTTQLSPAVRAAYDAPFPQRRYQAGARQFPVLVPTKSSDPAIAANHRAWAALGRWEKPFLTAFSDRDPITRGWDERFQRHISGTQGQPHTTIHNAGHFLQEDRGPEFAQVVVDFIAKNPH